VVCLAIFMGSPRNHSSLYMLLRTSDCLLKLLKEGDLAVFSHRRLHRYIYLCSRHWKPSKDEGIYTFILGNLDLQVAMIQHD
jgi:hypothetical protein